MKVQLISKLLLNFFLILSLASVTTPYSSAQRIGEEAEMNRLEQQADDLASQNDPEGAALAIGKAAMMADLLVSTTEQSTAKNIFQAASHLYRGQELGLRALALFQQTGGTPPAPPGVCHYLFQGRNKLNHSMKFLTENSAIPMDDLLNRRNHLIQKNEEWRELFQGLQEELACPNISS